MKNLHVCCACVVYRYRRQSQNTLRKVKLFPKVVLIILSNILLSAYFSLGSGNLFPAVLLRSGTLFIVLQLAVYV